MKKILFRIIIMMIFVFIGIKSYSQKDLIITQAGEEIRCKILDETPTRFKYAYLGPKNKILRNEIFKNLVSSFKYGYYSSDILKNDKIIEKTKASPSNRATPLAPSNENDVPKKDTKKSKKTETEKVDIVAVKEQVKEEDNSQVIGKNTDEKSSKTELSSKTKNEVSEKTNPEKPLNTTTNAEKVEEEAQKIDPQEEKQNVEVARKEAKKEEVSPLADPEPVSEFKNYLKYRVGVKGGLGNIISSNTDTSPYGLYKEKLLRGWMFGVDAAYFFKDNVGIGATYTNYQAQNSSTSLDYPNLFTQEMITGGQLSNKVSHKFVGPTFLYRKNIDYKTFAIITLSPGMHLYSDKGLTNLAKYNFSGQAYGAAATLGLDFLLGNDIFGRDIILSLEGGYNYGQITKLNNGIESVNLATPINLNRLDFTIGLRFTRFPMYLR
ncbi:hypothetical protein EGI22_10945 [Lacihabitans sp. LS3-19]|uniref:hypothetical protein n=1 Tax=Lacihabitans sp. LS3-19 TaxID=2487335 RepID=UPI0020CE56BA|nr:hypothetical protein [Lacihabitans sp. LS3-19]MCP9768431.1 hypothetical protein [Lacihabitans sp. LS3-19]